MMTNVFERQSCVCLLVAITITLLTRSVSSAQKVSKQEGEFDIAHLFDSPLGVESENVEFPVEPGKAVVTKQHDFGHHHEEGPFGFMNDLTSRWNSFISGGKQEAPLSPTKLDGRPANIFNPFNQDANLVGSDSISPAPSAIARVVTKEEDKKKKGGLFSLEGIGDFIQLLFNPFELIKAIASHFRLDLKRFVDLIERGAIFGTEAVFSPLVITIRLIERVFVPDACRLKFMCRIGTSLVSFREHVLKMSPRFLETSHQVKAFSDGMVGRDCEAAFPTCEPKLKKPFDDLRGTAQAGTSGTAVVSQNKPSAHNQMGFFGLPAFNFGQRRVAPQHHYGPPHHHGPPFKMPPFPWF